MCRSLTSTHTQAVPCSLSLNINIVQSETSHNMQSYHSNSVSNLSQGVKLSVRSVDTPARRFLGVPACGTDPSSPMDACGHNEEGFSIGPAQLSPGISFSRVLLTSGLYICVPVHPFNHSPRILQRVVDHCPQQRNEGVEGGGWQLLHFIRAPCKQTNTAIRNTCKVQHSDAHYQTEYAALPCT